MSINFLNAYLAKMCSSKDTIKKDPAMYIQTSTENGLRKPNSSGSGGSGLA